MLATLKHWWDKLFTRKNVLTEYIVPEPVDYTGIRWMSKRKPQVINRIAVQEVVNQFSISINTRGVFEYREPVSKYSAAFSGVMLDVDFIKMRTAFIERGYSDMTMSWDRGNKMTTFYLYVPKVEDIILNVPNVDYSFPQ